MSRIDELNHQLTQLDTLVQNGTLTEQATLNARNALRLQLDRLQSNELASQPSPRHIAGLIVGITVLAVLLAIGLRIAPEKQSVKATQAAAQAPVPAPTSSQPNSAPSTANPAEGLMAHLKAHPDDAAAWTSLGRIFLANGQVEDALQAQRKVIGLKPDNAQAYADLADILAIANGRSLEGASEKALLKALELDADNVKALALSGTLALSRGQAEKAAQFWERALRNSAANAPLSAQLERAIALARSRAP